MRLSPLVSVWPRSSTRGTLTRPGLRLMKQPRPLPLPTTRVSIACSRSYIWAMPSPIQNVRKPAHGTHSFGKSLPRGRRMMATVSDQPHCTPLRFIQDLDQTSGREVLQAIVRSHREQYDALTSDEKADLIRQFDDHKANKVRGLRISTKSRINDVTHTLRAIENEVHIFLLMLFEGAHLFPPQVE